MDTAMEHDSVYFLLCFDPGISGIFDYPFGAYVDIGFNDLVIVIKGDYIRIKIMIEVAAIDIQQIRIIAENDIDISDFLFVIIKDFCRGSPEFGL